jgi:hypothetical protein
MTTDEFKKKFRQFRQEAFNFIKAQAPYRTGTLKNNIRYEQHEDGFSIIIDIWYMQYTEEAWTYNKRWGKTLINKNEGWFRQAVETIVMLASMYFKGVVRVVT